MPEAPASRLEVRSWGCSSKIRLKCVNFLGISKLVFINTIIRVCTFQSDSGCSERGDSDEYL